MRHWSFGFFVGLFLLLSFSVFGLPPQADIVGNTKEMDYDSYFDANRIFMLVSNGGHLAYDRTGLWGRADGLYYPYTGFPTVPGGKTMVYSSGLFMGGKVDGQL